MTLMRRPSPFGELVTLRQAMDRFFDDNFVGGRVWPFETTATLPLDVTNATDALVVDAALPGMKPEDVQITVEDGTLTIRAESHSESETQEGETLIKEIRRGSMSRAVTLPSGLEADKATATFENGVLHLRIPKAETVKPRQIQITPSIEGTATAPETKA